MTDFVSIRRNLETEKERIKKIEETISNKLTSTIDEIDNAISFLNKTEQTFYTLEQNLDIRKRDEIQLQNEKKELLNNVDTLNENIERVKFSIHSEEEKITGLDKELSALATELEQKRNELTQTQNQITMKKDNIKSKNQEMQDTESNMQNRLEQSQQILAQLQKDEDQDMRISPILDFLLKEVRIDIPEVEILSVLAYRNKAMGMEELKKAVSKTPPVIILKAIRNLDSKGVIKYDERLDTIEIVANLV